MAAGNYDVFISYRRDGGDGHARAIRDSLIEKKVRVFLDVADLRKGYFDEELLTRIAEAPNFIIILAPHSLDRSINEEDWLRREIAHAIKTNRTIIPVMMPGFTFPHDLPPDIKMLPRYQGVEYSNAYYDTMVDRIVEVIEADRKAREVEAEHLNAEQDRLAREKAEADRKASEVEAARLKAEQDRLVRERAEADRKASEVEAARLNAEQDRLVREKAEADRKASEVEAERLRAEQDRLARVEAERQARAYRAAEWARRRKDWGDRALAARNSLLTIYHAQRSTVVAALGSVVLIGLAAAGWGFITAPTFSSAPANLYRDLVDKVPSPPGAPPAPEPPAYAYIPTVTTISQADQINTLVDQGDSEFANRRYDRAVDDYKQALKLAKEQNQAPDAELHSKLKKAWKHDVDSLSGQADSYRNSGKYCDAKRQYLKALNLLEPDFGDDEVDRTNNALREGVSQTEQAYQVEHRRALVCADANH